MSALLKNTALALGRSFSFKALELSDQAYLQEFLRQFPQRISGFTFAALFAWNPVYRYEWAAYGEKTIFISCRIDTTAEQHFLQPVGSFGAEEQGILLDALSQLPHTAKIFGVSAEFIAKNPSFLSHFDIQEDPALANYTYRVSDLAQLPGKFYAKKRNLIAQAHKSYAWSVSALTAENAAECVAALERIDPLADLTDTTRGNEAIALRTALRHFAELGQSGIVISVDRKTAAFSIFEPLNSDTAVEHFEKADRHYKGLYQIINQETAHAAATRGFSFLNREEDMGIDGLRQAKTSYGPSEVIPSYTLSFRR